MQGKIFAEVVLCDLRKAMSFVGFRISHESDEAARLVGLALLGRAGEEGLKVLRRTTFS
jgi:hypothetical protein